MKIVLLSTYELGRQPFGLASPAAWLRERGHTVACADLAVGTLPTLEVREADLIGIYLPMHTATRLAAPLIGRVRALNPAAHLCGYGLYGPVNEAYLRSLGVHTVLGGEFEAALAHLADRLAAGGSGPQSEPVIALDRLAFRTPDRTGLPVLARYPKLIHGAARKRVGYTEASRGCKHLCRHCPVVPVYNGLFRIVPPDVVLEDVRRQVAAGAEHISFGDPDFLNGPAHARRVVESVHREFPELSWDVTIKVEHLLQHRDLLPVLRENGCLFVISAVESVQDDVLARLEKHHTRADFLELLRLFRAAELTLSPTFLPFTPWTTVTGFRELLQILLDEDLVDNVAPVQLALRLLIPSGSRLLELADVKQAVLDFDPAGLVWRWKHADPAVDELAASVLRAVTEGTKAGKSRREIFGDIWDRPLPPDFSLLPRTVIPYMEEPWFC